MANQLQPKYEMPPQAVAVFDMVVAFFLLFVPGSAVLLVHEGYGAPLGPVQIGVVGLLVGFGSVVCYALVRRRSLRWCIRPGWALGRYLLFLVVWFPLAFWLYPLLMRSLGIPLPAQEVLRYVASWPTDGFLWVALLAACVVAPVAEELFFRGFLFRAISLYTHRYVAVVMTSALFALAHEVSVMLPIFLLGLYFGYLRMKTGGVGSSILVHMVHNVVTIAAAMAAPELLDLVFDK